MLYQVQLGRMLALYLLYLIILKKKHTIVVIILIVKRNDWWRAFIRRQTNYTGKLTNAYDALHVEVASDTQDTYIQPYEVDKDHG